jgi:hypothetical protein
MLSCCSVLAAGVYATPAAAVSSGLTNLGVATNSATFSRDGVVFAAPEAGEGLGGTDLNGDGDTSDKVVHVWNATTGVPGELASAITLMYRRGAPRSWSS